MNHTNTQVPNEPSRAPTNATHGSCILTINGGSSSLKFAVFAPGIPPARLASGRVERIGMQGSRLVVADADAGRSEDVGVQASDQASAAALVTERLDALLGGRHIGVVGHRVVHGGSRFYNPVLITREILEELMKIVPYDPDHLPGEIEAIEAFQCRNEAGTPLISIQAGRVTVRVIRTDEESVIARAAVECLCGARAA